jgi:hypothetical protein
LPEGADPLEALVKKMPLPKGVAMRIAKYALPGKRLAKYNILYGLLMHYRKVPTKLTMKALSRMIEEAEAEFPESHERRSPRQKAHTPPTTTR